MIYSYALFPDRNLQNTQNPEHKSTVSGLSNASALLVWIVKMCRNFLVSVLSFYKQRRLILDIACCFVWTHFIIIIIFPAALKRYRRQVMFQVMYVRAFVRMKDK